MATKKRGETPPPQKVGNVLLRNLSQSDSDTIELLMEHFREATSSKAVLQAIRRYMDNKDTMRDMQRKIDALQGRVDELEDGVAAFSNGLKKLGQLLD